MTITGAGNVGIGTTNPQGSLELYSSTLNKTHIRVYADDPTVNEDRIFELTDVNGSGLLQMGDRFNNNSSTYKIQLNTEGNSFFNGGSVGIGTNAPGGLLEIQGSSSNRFRFDPLASSDTSIVDRTTLGATSFFKKMMMAMENRAWYFGVADNNGRFALAYDGGGGADPDVVFAVTTSGALHAGDVLGKAGTFSGAGSFTNSVLVTGSSDTVLTVKNTTTPAIIRTLTTGGQVYFQSGTAFTGDSRADINFTSMYANTTYMKIQASTGNVGIGLTNPGTIGSTNYPGVTPILHLMGDIYQSEPSDNETWSLGVSSNDYFFRVSVNGNAITNVAKIGYTTGAYSDLIAFTGQHRAAHIESIPPTKAEDYEGLIVSADRNKYESVNGYKSRGIKAITVNEAMPLLSLSKMAYDKKCFGVISASEDPDSRTQRFGNLETYHYKEPGDTFIFINSVGEGAMWVVNTAGPLESGDYITTSNVAGYGQRQESEFLANYTVAKITMDCDFSPPDIPVQRIVKELSNITYWYQLEDATSNAYDRTQEETYYTKDRHVEVHGHVDEQSNVFVPPDHDLELYSKTQVNTVSEEVYNALPEDEQALYDSNTFTYTQVIEISPEVWSDLGDEEQNTYVHGYFNILTDEVPSETPGAVERTRTVYKNIINETKVEPATPEDYFSEVRQEWVNVLDEHDQIQWEDVPWGDTEPAYRIRYLDASGQITTRHNEVYRAAFVGVTYHCG